MTKDDDYRTVLFEEVRDQNKRILEALQSMAGMPSDLRQVKEDVSELKWQLSLTP